MHTLSDFFHLFLGSIIYRPYVYLFFLCFLVFASYHLGIKRMLIFLTSTYLIAFLSEYSATRNGFPFGPYTYYDVTRARELWISNVPFWDSLSFVFLSYFSFVLAGSIGFGFKAKSTPWIGGLLMMLLDVVIDPVALQGEKWFLGKIYDYPFDGFYFGVTAANFAGWFFVGFISQWVFQKFIRSHLKTLSRNWLWSAYGVYAGVFLFNLSITIYIKDYTLALASTCVSVLTLSGVGYCLWKKS